MTTLDLNAKRAARSEAENTPHEVKLGFDEQGQPRSFLLKPRMPVEYMDLLREERGSEALRLLMVHPEDFELLRLEEPDVQELEAITALYAVSAGESAGSPSSSSNGGPSSNTGSKPSTGLILPVPAGERALLGSDGSTP